MLKKKNFISIIESFKGFSNPDIKLEQYNTDSISTADLIYYVGFDNNDLVGNIIIDLGAGTGRLGLSALIFGASFLISIEKDKEAIQILLNNAEIYDLQDKVITFQEDIMELILKEDVHDKFITDFHRKLSNLYKKNEITQNSIKKRDLTSDKKSIERSKICIMNPPFGVHNKKIDRYFLRIAMEISDKIYSIHLSNKKTREFITKYVNKYDWEVLSIHSQKIAIKNTYAFHKKPQKQILADVYRILPIEK